LNSNKIRIIYIGGEGRSGSTLLARMLGQLGGVFLGGEIRLVWRCLVEENPCGCGRCLLECETWRRVVDRVLPCFELNSALEVEQLRKRVDRVARLPGYVWHRQVPNDSDAARFLKVTSNLYRAIMAVTGCSAIVDSSKSPSYLSLLGLLPELDLRVIHLIRDSRGVAYSLGKHVQNPGAPRSLPRYNALEAGARWTAINSLLPLMRNRLPGPSLLLRYEDLVEDPRGALDAVLGVAGITVPDNYPFLSNGTVRLDQDHTIAGNPMRFKTGEIPLRTDEAWHRELSLINRLVVTITTLPSLVAYGYVPNRKLPRAVTQR